MNNIKKFKYFTLIGTLFVSVLLISNITTQKVAQIGIITVDIGTLFFPISYIFNNIFTEVYGFRNSRQIIWTGLICNIIMVIVLQLVTWMPVAPGWHLQAAFEHTVGMIPRIVIASMLAYLGGELVNSYVLARIKVLTKGQFLWFRTISSTATGVAVDTMVFTIIAFAGTLPVSTIVHIIAWEYIIKVGYEILGTPITYLVTYALKKAEGVDVYDYDLGVNRSSNPSRQIDSVIN